MTDEAFDFILVVHDANCSMSSPPAKLSVFVSGHQVCLKISGRANFTSSIDFKTLVSELLQKGFTYFVLDLSECVLMDSTFLGVLAGFGLKMVVAPGGDGSARSIELRNPNNRIAELLENLGVAHLFKIVNCPDNLPGDKESPCAPCAEPTREEVTRNCLEAHQTLMEIAPANIPRFKDVAQFLAEDLKKARAAS